MKKISIALLSVLMLTASITSCSKDFLDTNPTTSLSDETLKQTTEGIEGVMEGIHSMFYTYTFAQVFGYGAASLNTQLDLLGNTFVNSRPAYHMGTYRWTDHRDPNGDLNFRAWDFNYTIIQHCNTILTMSENLTGVDPKRLNTLRGEAHIIRGYCYSYLTQLFGKRFVKGGANSSLGVILRLDPNIDPMPRSTVAECFAQVNKDIEEGLKELNEANNLNRKNRISLATAYGIAARTALAQQDYAKAEQYANKAIEKFSGKLQAGNDLLDGFNNYEATEWMWGYRQASDQNLYYAGYGAQYSYNYKGHNQALRFAINRSYYDKMGAKDIRRKWFVALDQGDQIPADADGSYFAGGTSAPGWEITGQLIKYKTKDKLSTFMDNCLMRLGEMYYIAAEAQARQGRVADAAKTLDKVMAARDPEYKANVALSQDEMAKEVLRNKKIDLCFEGAEFFDIKRLGEVPNRLATDNDKYMTAAQKETYVARNSGSNVTGMPKSADDNVWEFIIPYDEIKGNKLCEQNPF